MDLDPVLLSRLQFFWVVAFHILLPAFTVGLASYIAVLEGLHLVTGRAVFLSTSRYWIKIFAVSFGMGVVSGIVMPFQFGTNWSRYSDATANVVGPLMAYEGLTAFFLEAGFLGVMLFGMARVGMGLHFFATCMVAFGTFVSAFWILSANSWMHTPAGYAIGANGQFIPGPSWLAVIFNPSFPYRLVHTVIAAYLTTAFAVGGVGAWHLLHGRANEHVRTMFSMAMWMAALVVPVQILAGDEQGLNTLEHQPAKVMAMEGHFQSHPHGAPLVLFGIPDSARDRVDYAVEIPKASSLILKHDPDAPLAGLDTVPRADRPPVGTVFWAFRVMVGLGFAMLGVGLWSLLARWRGKLYEWTWLHRAALVMGPSGFVAVIAGWVVTEAGRQPWVVYGLLRTAKAASPLDAPAVASSLLAFMVIYFAVFGVGVWYILRLAGQSPHPGEGGVARDMRAPIRSAGITPAAQEAGE
jgi:cytochrome d ubiquinol oxidase subunit I